MLTRAGLEVEAIEHYGQDIAGVVVAEVVGKKPHPKADRLTVVDVIDSAGGDVTQVVCGASNVPVPGGRVAWAKPGATLPGGLRLETRALKGVPSHGMLCSAAELGIDDDSEGIVVLDATLAIGENIVDELSLRQTVLDIASPANRGDVLSHVGVARELGALTGSELIDYEGRITEALRASTQSGVSEPPRVVIHDPEACPRYVARRVAGVTVGASPWWMQSRLRAVGIRPISNLVDVTNYVMFELGQPLHAFDAGALHGQNIEVRLANSGESITTLDDTQHELSATDLLICDERDPVALAGVMGGKSSQVTPSTTEVVLESAVFRPIAIRRTARRLGLHSESSHRFGRGVDPNGVALASARASGLISQVSGGTVASQVVDAYPSPRAPWSVSLRTESVSALTGVCLSQQRIAEVLRSLQLGVSTDASVLQVTCPTFRSDLTREVDLIEEVIRIDGFDKVPATLPASSVSMVHLAPDPRPSLIREQLIGMGLSEAITFGFMAESRLAKMLLPRDDPRNRPLRVQNPMSEDQAIMRTMLLPNLLAAVTRNRSFGTEDVAVFEVGSVFLPMKGETLPNEPIKAVGVLCGRQTGWLGDRPAVDVFDAKACVERVLARILGHLEEVAYGCSQSGYFHPGVAGSVSVGGLEVGEFGEVHPDVREAFGIDAPCFAFELSLDKLPQPLVARMRPIPKYPAISRDISIFVDESLPSSEIRAAIVAAEQPLIEEICVLEDYRDPAKVAKGKKGMLWSITYRASERTLTDTEVDKAHAAIVDCVVATVSAELR